MQKLSRRMEAVAGLCRAGDCVADVGCDHAYVSIRLLQQQRFAHAIAMDVRKGPLAAAQEHVAASGLADRIECRLSDGVSALAAGEADALICAGMGGVLIMSILSAGMEKVRRMRQLILQPQSEIASVRAFLRENGFCIEAEEMVEEEGKFYSAFRAAPGGGEEDTAERFLYYGKSGLEKKDPVLKRFLEREKRINSEVLAQLSAAGGSRAGERRSEVEKKLLRIERALAYYT